MSLDKAILHGKEKRKPYRNSKAIDKTCRNHGSCSWCKQNRLHKFRDKRSIEEEKIMIEIFDSPNSCDFDVHELDMYYTGDNFGFEDDEIKQKES